SRRAAGKHHRVLDPNGCWTLRGLVHEIDPPVLDKRGFRERYGTRALASEVVFDVELQQPVEIVLPERHQCLTAMVLRASRVAAMIFCSLRSDRPACSQAPAITASSSGASGKTNPVSPASIAISFSTPAASCGRCLSVGEGTRMMR